MANVAKKGGKVEIREIMEEDLEAILELDRKLIGKQRAITYRNPIGTYLGGDFGLSFVAVDNKKIVGFVMGQIEGPGKGWIQTMAVDPEYRRHKIGIKLVEALLARFRSKGIDTVHIAASWRDAGMLSFLNSLGFTRGDMVQLEKTL
jgi:ribosomal protein S18 acetylase RimI-like enzyme